MTEYASRSLANVTTHNDPERLGVLREIALYGTLSSVTVFKPILPGESSSPHHYALFIEGSR
jgi:hypothetical protein